MKRSSFLKTIACCALAVKIQLPLPVKLKEKESPVDTSGYIIGRGKMFFAELDTCGKPVNFRAFGDARCQ